MKSYISSSTTRRSAKAVWYVLIIAAATAAGMFCAWRAPELNLYAQDLLMRERGNLAEPNDIIIVAIDEPSIAHLGQFPWKRDYTARVLNTISAAKPKAITLDVLYSEPTNPSDDKALADAVRQAGNVIISEQLIENRDTPELSRAEWLKSLPEIKNAAAGVGHVNVETEQDGAAREMLLRLADDDGEPRWALALETVRVGDNLNENDINETNSFVRVGTRKIPFSPNESNLAFKVKDIDSHLTTIPPLRMKIDYIGATGSFSPQTVSFSDVLEGRISPERFRGKYVLIGATAATLGDRIATPFVHTENAEGDQHGDLMPGVEILANSVNTILRERFYQPVSDWTAFLCAALTAIAVIFLIGLAEGKFEAAKQLSVLFGLAAVILVGSYLIFANALIIPPVVPMGVSFIVAAPLGLLRRSLSASASLDERISELINAENHLLDNGSERLSANFDNNFRKSDIPQNNLTGKLFPHGLERKTQDLGLLSRDLISRSLFVDSALHSLEEGLIIAETDGHITFVNQSAARILGLPKRKLIGSDLFTRIVEAENKGEKASDFAEEALAALLIDRTSVEREIIIGEAAAERHYVLRLSAVMPQTEGVREALGIIVTLSDITHHRELQKTKNEIITLVTHELRTPLTAIQGMSEVLTEHEVERDSQQKMLMTINTESKRLARMINDYLDISRLESGMQKAQFTAVDTVALLERILLMLEPVAFRRNIKIVNHCELTEAIISADAEMLNQALTNVIANAIKYSAENTTITVETRMADEKLRISITDEGYGISAEQLPRIFEKFYRVPHRRNSEVSGTGLGLALTREIVELHGGRITVKSEPNIGSVFTIYLPVTPEI